MKLVILSKYCISYRIEFLLFSLSHAVPCARFRESEMKETEEENKVSAENIIHSQTFLIYKQRSFCSSSIYPLKDISDRQWD
jgi:hypothetical protein